MELLALLPCRPGELNQLNLVYKTAKYQDISLNLRRFGVVLPQPYRPHTPPPLSSPSLSPFLHLKCRLPGGVPHKTSIQGLKSPLLPIHQVAHSPLSRPKRLHNSSPFLLSVSTIGSLVASSAPALGKSESDQAEGIWSLSQPHSNFCICFSPQSFMRHVIASPSPTPMPHCLFLPTFLPIQSLKHSATHSRAHPILPFFVLFLKAGDGGHFYQW